MWYLALLGLVPLVAGLTDEEIAIINKRGAESAGRCGSKVSAELNNAGGMVLITTNGLPDHEWGCVNPNHPLEDDLTYRVPVNPEFAANGPFCLPPATTGVAYNGVAFFNPLAAGGVNAVEGTSQEVFDCCDGHAEERDGRYHYHKLPHTRGTCNFPIFNPDDQKLPQFLGVNFDGFPIYSQWDTMNISDLDECHGLYLPDKRYAYIAVQDHFPYVAGCYKGTPYNLNMPVTPCPNAKVDGLCDCLYGQLTYDDVTLTHQKYMDTLNKDLSKWYTQWKHHAASRKMPKQDEPLIMPMSAAMIKDPRLRSPSPHNVEECHDIECGRGIDFINGRCRVRPPPPYFKFQP